MAVQDSPLAKHQMELIGLFAVPKEHSSVIDDNTNEARIAVLGKLFIEYVSSGLQKNFSSFLPRDFEKHIPSIVKYAAKRQVELHSELNKISKTDNDEVIVLLNAIKEKLSMLGKGLHAIRLVYGEYRSNNSELSREGSQLMHEIEAQKVTICKLVTDIQNRLNSIEQSKKSAPETSQQNKPT